MPRVTCMACQNARTLIKPRYKVKKVAPLIDLAQKHPPDEDVGVRLELLHAFVHLEDDRVIVRRLGPGPPEVGEHDDRGHGRRDRERDEDAGPDVVTGTFIGTGHR